MNNVFVMGYNCRATNCSLSVISTKIVTLNRLTKAKAVAEVYIAELFDQMLPSHLKSTMDVGIPKLRTLMYDAPWVPWTTGMTLQCSNSTRKSMTYQSMTRHNNTNNAKTLRSSNSTRKCKTFQNITNQIYEERMCYTKKYDEPNMVWTDVLHQKIRRTKYSMNRCAAPKNMTNQI